jgi:hypothetical protein
VDKRGCFVPAFVAGEPQGWQSYLRFLADRPVFLAGFAAGFLAAGRDLGFALAPAGFAADFAGAGRELGRPSPGAL